MIFALLYGLPIMLASISFEIVISNATINQKYAFQNLNNAYQTPRKTIEMNSNIVKDITHSRRKRQLNNQKYQNITLTKKIIPMMDEDIKHRRRKRHTNNERNCHGLCRRSLCQWTESWNFDSNRNPAFIPKANCNSQCNFNWATVVSPNVNVYTECEPIKKDIPIFKNNEYTYIKHWPVACACTIKHISSLQRKQTIVPDKTKYEKLKKKGQRRWVKVKSKHKHSVSKYVEINKRLMTPFLFLTQFKK